MQQTTLTKLIFISVLGDLTNITQKDLEINADMLQMKEKYYISLFKVTP